MSIEADFLYSISKEAESDFKKSQSILSFQQYLTLVLNNPKNHLRNCAQYFDDLIDSFGTYEKNTPIGKYRRYKLFDAEHVFSEGQIFGHEKVQSTIANYVKDFCRYGRIDKLLLLHGPNGSAKTSIVQALVRGIEHYCQSDQGAIYQFSWIFPKKEVQGKSLGFAKSLPNGQESYAFLADEAIDACLPCEQRDHPLLLLSLSERNKFLQKIINQKENMDIKIADTLSFGQLSHKNRQIFQALFKAYHGDLSAVFKHVRVERFYFSKRYRKGVSVVEPQLSLDAFARQISNDQSILSLPVALRHVSLYEVLGPLSEANRGLIEYSDLLKRPIDTWKYLLVACEQAEVSVSFVSLALDMLMIATSNELHLASFRKYPDWQSFKGRIELIRVPYLLRFSDEVLIYKNQIPKALKGVHIAPYAIEVAARFAVLTRLEPPCEKNYEPELKDLILGLSPEEKLELYDEGQVPSRLSQKDGKVLKSKILSIFSEYHNELDYEGRFGASPREIRTLLLNAFWDRNFDHLSVMAVFLKLEELIEQKSSYEFLRLEPVRGFRDPKHLLLLVKEYYRRIVMEEIRSSIGLYHKESYLELFKRYICHVSAWIKKESLVDPFLNKKMEADEQFMLGTEKKILAKNEASDDFRKSIISQIGAFRVEQPQKDVDYGLLFSTPLRLLKESMFDEQKQVILRILWAYLALEKGERASYDDKEISHAIKLKEGLLSLGYNDESAHCAVSFLTGTANEQKIKSEYQGNFNF